MSGVCAVALRGQVCFEWSTTVSGHFVDPRSAYSVVATDFSQSEFVIPSPVLVAGFLNVCLWPKADIKKIGPEFPQIPNIRTSAFRPKPDIRLKWAERAAFDPKRTLVADHSTGI